MRAPWIVGPALESSRARERAAWTAFWQEPGQSRCLAGAPDIHDVLARHWSLFASGVEPGARVLDLGCGAGAVGRSLLAASRDMRVTGIDFAKVPLVIHTHVELLSDTAMEALPFADASFAAVTSQFGFEYSDTARAAQEMARVLAPEGRFSLVAHHATSGIVATDRVNLSAINAIVGPSMRLPFCSGDALALDTQLSRLVETHRGNTLVMQLARALPIRVGRAQRERAAIWNAIEEALAPEICLAEALQSSCIAPPDLDRWLMPLRAVGEVTTVSVLREPNGAPIAWNVSGVCHQR